MTKVVQLDAESVYKVLRDNGAGPEDYPNDLPYELLPKSLKGRYGIEAQIINAMGGLAIPDTELRIEGGE